MRIAKTTLLITRPDTSLILSMSRKILKGENVFMINKIRKASCDCKNVWLNILYD